MTTLLPDSASLPAIAAVWPVPSSGTAVAAPPSPLDPSHILLARRSGLAPSVRLDPQKPNRHIVFDARMQAKGTSERTGRKENGVIHDGLFTIFVNETSDSNWLVSPSWSWVASTDGSDDVSYGWLYPLGSAASTASDQTASNEIAVELAALNDGWNGEGSLAPSAATRADIANVLKRLHVAASPSIEVDDDGSVALLWETPKQTFALTFYGNGRVTGTLSPFSAEYRPWTRPVDDDAWLSSVANYHTVAALLG